MGPLRTDLLAKTLSALTLGVAVFDPDHRLLFHNARFAELLEWPRRTSLPGLSYRELVVLNRRHGVANIDKGHLGIDEHLRRLRLGQAPYRATLSLPSGNVLTMRHAPMSDGGFIVTYRRVTKRIRAEEEAERSLALARAEQERTEAANRAKSEFLAKMSHELRTPLNAIIGFAQLVAEEVKGPVGTPCYRDYAAHIQDSGLHLLAIINDLLDLSKIESGKLHLHEERIDIGEVFGASLALIAQRAKDGRVDLTTDAPPDIPPAWADGRMIKQIVINLLSNAVKFTKPGGHVHLAAAWEPGGELAITVTDTGVGMTEAEIPLALEPFSQIDGHAQHSREGTGLGLPLVKSMIELHGGRLVIESARGRGTIATAYLPASRVLRAAS